MASITEIKSEIKRMEAGKFQVLCDRFLAKEGLIPTSSLGMQAGTYKTTPGTPDTYIYMDNGKYIFVEYTTQQDNIVSKITDDLNKCFDIGKTGIPLDKIDRIYYFHTSSNIKPEDDMKLRGLCSSKKVSLVLIGIDTLAESLRKYPSIIKEELNLEIGTEQIQAVDEFIQQYNTAKTAAPLDTTFLFRTQEIEKLKMLFADKDAVILTGDAGVGKTRLALAYAQDHAKEHRETLLCIHDRSLSIYDDLIIALEQPGCYFFLIDDANQLSNLKLIVETITQKLTDYSFKLLITSRNYAAAKVKNEISDIVDYDVLQLEKLSDNEIKEIVKENLGIINTKYLDRIAVIAEGNARLAMLAGRLALKENCLSSINDVSSLYDVYFSSAFQEAKLSQERDMLISAGIVAFLDRIHLEHIDFLIPLLDSKGITQEQFILAFSQWLNSDKMFYYNLLAGPSYFEIRDYDARGKAQCAGIQEYMRTCPSKLNVVLKMLSIYQNLGEKKYSTNRGINTALQELGENESDFAQASRYILQNDLTFGIDIGYIIQKLFSFMTSIEVKQFITENAKSELDISKNILIANII